MPKDNENIPLLDIGPLAPSEPQAFARDQMVPCESCMRMNPPTRVNCLYCGAPFTFNEKHAPLQKPSLRPMEKWEQGYSSILVPGPSNELSEQAITEVASLLKLNRNDLQRILACQSPLPVALAPTSDEALLIQRRLADFGIRSLVVADGDLQLEEQPPIRIRAAQLNEDGILAHQSGAMESVYLLWAGLTLMVHGRLVTKSIEVKEQGLARDTKQIVDASETYADEAVVDLYSRDLDGNVRISANSFDFSCLEEQKGLLANENFNTLLKVILDRASQVVVDTSYKSVRQALEPVWFSQKQTASMGWRRERPGKITLGNMTEISNENQFTRYSRLRNHFFTHRHLYEVV